MSTVYVSIGNSDDKLTQAEWAMFADDVHTALSATAHRMHGDWYSEPSSPWQNACWCVEFESEMMIERAKKELAKIARRYRQDSIAWAWILETEFIAPLASGA